jgi:hypothetical protein
MRGKSGFTNKISHRRFGNALPSSASGLKKPETPPQADAIEVPAAINASTSGVPVPTLTKEELLSRAKRNIDSCERPLREAAEDIAQACEQGATQRDIALAVGKSPAWVNRLLKWRLSGYAGSAFADKRVQGVNKKSVLPALAVTGTVLPPISWVQSGNTTKAEPHVGISPESADTALNEQASSGCGRDENVSDIVPSRAVTSTVADASVQRHNLIEALEFLTSTRPGFRAKLALIVEARRAELGLTWDQLIIPAGAFHVARNEPTS